MTVTRPFDEHTYPVPLTPALLEVVAYARQNGGTFTTKDIMSWLDIGYWAAYRRLRRLRELGIVHSQYTWLTRDNGSRKAVSRDGHLWGWLVYWLLPMDRWGDRPDDLQVHFGPGGDRCHAS